jgi:hypothetical protein
MKLYDSSPITFRQDLKARIQLAAHDIYSKTGPMPEMEAFIVSQTKWLRDATWRQVLQAGHLDRYSSLSSTSSFPPNSFLDVTPWASLDDVTLSYGIARNPISAVGGSEVIGQRIMGNPEITWDRDPQMQTGTLGLSDETWAEFFLPDGVRAFFNDDLLRSWLRECPAGLRAIYEQSITPEGDIVVSDELRPQLEQAAATGITVGSADLSPVFYFGPPGGDPFRLFYCRGLFVKSDIQTGQQENQGSLFQQAALTLRVAGAAIRRPLSDGEWIYIRWLDTVPGVEDFLATLANWVEAIRASLQSIIDTIRKYIEYIEARIVELQQLILRINSLLQSILGFMFQIPKCSVLTLLSTGTGGVLADLVQAENKPSDSPLAYGGGVAVVIPLFPSFAFLDLLLAFWKPEPGVSPSGFMGQDPATVQGIDGIPVVPPEPVEPDVL